MVTTDARKERVRRWLRRAALVLGAGLVGFYVLYLVAANVVLRTHSLNRWVTGATKGLFLRIDSGWTIWPGRVHLRGVELHFEDYNVQFEVALDSGVVDLALLQLPWKIFHLTRVRAEGVRFLFRHRVHDTNGIEARLARYPKIQGYADPPRFEGPKTPPLSDEEYDLWTIELEDVDAIAKELWFLEYRFVGRGRASGGFHLKPERDARTEWCRLSLDGQLRVGTAVAATRLVGTIEAQLDRHDPRKVDGAQVFAKISAKTNLSARIPALDFSSIYAGDDGVRLQRGRGLLRIQTDLRHGAWQETTHVHYETDGLAVVQKRFVSEGPLVIGAEIVQGGRDSVLQLTSAAPRVGLTYADGDRRFANPSAHGVMLSLGVTADLTQPLRLRSIESRGRATVPELRFFNHALDDESPRFTGGSAHADLNLRWTERETAHGRLALELKDAGTMVSDRALIVSGTAEALANYDARSRRGSFRRLRIDLPELAVTTQGKWKPLPGGARAEGDGLRFHDFPPRAIRGDVQFESASLEPLLPLVISSGLLRAIASAIVHFGPTHATVGISRGPGALTLDLKEAQSGTLTALGTLRKDRDSDQPCGRFFIQDPHLSLGVELYRGKTTIKPFVSPNYWRERPPLRSCGPEAAADADSEEQFFPETGSEESTAQSP